ncbi:hypothetical protein [Circoviridae SFBeef]|uniref:hypothetical protein n=1 Tax=Circoviridae SFBeef TaxID=1548712 RepID=UPI00050C0960|nr:hypothetical protein [Circoviridae SFBeef]AIR09408.1 hypothetical protein [Circoviridae SFBeef]
MRENAGSLCGCGCAGIAVVFQATGALVGSFSAYSSVSHFGAGLVLPGTSEPGSTEVCREKKWYPIMDAPHRVSGYTGQWMMKRPRVLMPQDGDWITEFLWCYECPEDKDFYCHPILGPEGKPETQVVFYDKQLDPDRVGIYCGVWRQYSEIPYYRQRGWKKRYPTLARVREFQEQKATQLGEALTRIWSGPSGAGEGEPQRGQRVLQERGGLPRDWRRFLFGYQIGSSNSSSDSDGDVGKSD